MPRRPRLPPLLSEFDDDERDAVLAANRAFYRAFNDRDYESMEQIWAPTGAMVCLHPGQGPLHDRAVIDQEVQLRRRRIQGDVHRAVRVHYHLNA